MFPNAPRSDGRPLQCITTSVDRFFDTIITETEDQI